MKSAHYHNGARLRLRTWSSKIIFLVVTFLCDVRMCYFCAFFPATLCFTDIRKCFANESLLESQKCTKWACWRSYGGLPPCASVNLLCLLILLCFELLECLSFFFGCSMLLQSLLTTLPFSFSSFVIIIVLFVLVGRKRIGMSYDVHCAHFFV